MPGRPIVLVFVIVIESRALTGVSLGRPDWTDYAYDYAHEHDELTPTWNSPETVEPWEPHRLRRCIRVALLPKDKREDMIAHAVEKQHDDGEHEQEEQQHALPVHYVLHVRILERADGI